MSLVHNSIGSYGAQKMRLSLREYCVTTPNPVIFSKKAKVVPDASRANLKLHKSKSLLSVMGGDLPDIVGDRTSFSTILPLPQ